MPNWLEQIVNAGKAYLDYDVAKTQASQSTNKTQTNAGAVTTTDAALKNGIIIGVVVIVVIGVAAAVKKIFF